MRKKLLAILTSVMLALFIFSGCGDLNLPELNGFTVESVELIGGGEALIGMDEVTTLSVKFNGANAEATRRGDFYRVKIGELKAENTLVISAFGYKDKEIKLAVKAVAADGAELKTLISDAETGDIIVAPNGTISDDITINKSVVILGGAATELTGKITITADNVTLSGIKQKQKYTQGDASARLLISGKNFSYNYGAIERVDSVATPYGYIAEYNAEGGSFTAKETSFIAPYDKDSAATNAPSMVNCKDGSVNFSGCVFATNGYAFFDVHVTKGIIENSTFGGVNGEPMYSAINSMFLNGLTIKNNIFTDTVSNMLILAGKFDIIGNTFDATYVKETLYIGIYSNSGDINIKDNTFVLGNEKGRHYGIRLNSANWAPSVKQPQLITIEGNIFNGAGIYAIRNDSPDWKAAGELNIGENTLNGNEIRN